jgi:hypothetical protein
VIRSPDIPDGLADVRQRWTFADLLEAHMYLDALEDTREIEKARRERKGA